MKHYVEKIMSNKSLTETEMEGAADLLFSDDITDTEIAAFMTSLKMKGETVEEIVGIVKAVRKQTLSFAEPVSGCIDNCGTGGDKSQSFNISSTSAFVLAGAGIPVAKHGNRSISSKTGSADVLEELGIKLNVTPEQNMQQLEEVGITFLFAQHVQPKMGRIMKVRRELKLPTIFNLIGPLTNPISLESQVLGIYRSDLLLTFAESLRKLGRKRAVVLNGAGGMDEASLQGSNQLVILQDGRIEKTILTPDDVNLPYYTNDQIRGGDAKENAALLLKVLKGEKGAYRDTILLNAGIGIYTAGRAESIGEGVHLAKESIDSGAALYKLNQLVEVSKELEGAGI
ncbi:anthranilate phosphoribosyltransferase [Niallia circulans]|jgi:anthranilate phosphoribosyltransferase|uniref:Anthranilate phosphoribosyltransferase n=1 Tax=Niallia circulans TaxID=1397 RepID=A0A0J1LFY7_NIACI|nr:anthranilate phosphoribosyltransferase [Niallia circulans]KLV28035.1 anthranilate phosphoribosyltransferase [Niallia circulans]MDR4314858.1 anthranilate phosphoribosyltransferase [Niallia circulans]MED3837828.1 anthranilate phosphoribosyltransferase [Niallia circulans]MED4243025.1 anthranilate phosphoribosyltransferase [Niallia circulans]MED4247004.1 anthranilate phosphoribosyltransferase [Niallia circulans]